MIGMVLERTTWLRSHIDGSGIQAANRENEVRGGGLHLVPDLSPGPADARLIVHRKEVARLAQRGDGWWVVVGHEETARRTLPGLCFALASRLWEITAERHIATQAVAAHTT